MYVTPSISPGPLLYVGSLLYFHRHVGPTLLRGPDKVIHLHGYYSAIYIFAARNRGDMCYVM